MSARTRNLVELAKGAVVILAGCVLLPLVLLAHVAAVLAG